VNDKNPTNQKISSYGPQVERPLRVRVLQYASLVLAIAGLILLYLYSVHQDIPTVKISQISPTMNFATIRLSGEVTRGTYFFKSGGVVFNLHDGSGEIAILGNRAKAEALKKADKLPRRGDQIEVVGNLGISAEQEVKLRMQSVDQLILMRKHSPTSPIAPRSALADITPARKGEEVSVRGTLREISVPPPGSKTPYKLTLEEDGAQRVVVFWDDVFQGLGRKLPVPGKKISVRGKIDIYRNKVQLKVSDADAFRVETDR